MLSVFQFVLGFFPRILCFGLVWFYFSQSGKDFCLTSSLQLLSAAPEQGGKDSSSQSRHPKMCSDGEVLKQKRINTLPVTHGGVCSLHRSLQFPICLRDILPNYKKPQRFNRHVFHHYPLNLVKNSTSHICFSSQRVVWCCRREIWVRTPGRNLLRPAGAPEGTLPI